MKKKIFKLVVVLVAILLMGATSVNVLRTDDFGWETAGETTTAYTSPAVDERDYTNFTTNHSDAVVFTLKPYRWNAIGVRFIVDDDGDDTVFDVFATKGINDHFTQIATLTIKGGTQVGPPTSTATTSGVFADTITVTNGEWITTITTVDNAGGDTIATIWWDMNGFNTWGFVGTTVDDTTLVQITGH